MFNVKPEVKQEVSFDSCLPLRNPTRRKRTLEVPNRKQMYDSSSPLNSQALDYRDNALKDSNRSIIPKSPQLPDTDMSKSSMSLTPYGSFLIPTQSLSATSSPLPQLMQTTKSHTEQKISNSTMAVQYIVCCKCGKHRAVPSYLRCLFSSCRTLDISLLPHFECSMNIWDDNKYNSCMVEENVDINYSINLSVFVWIGG